MTRSTSRTRFTRTLAAITAVSCAALPLLASAACDGETTQAATSTRTPQDIDAPRVRLRVSGSLEGRLEPCGCASGQIGGLARRSFRNQAERGTYDFLLEGGDIVDGGTALDELKLMTILEVLDDRRAHYDAIALGPDDLELPRDLLSDFLGGHPQLPVVASDLVVLGKDGSPWPARPFVDMSKDGLTLRVASLTGRLPAATDKEQPTYRLLDPAAAWQLAMKDVAPSAFRVAFVHGGADRARALAKLQPKPDLLIAVGDASEPPAGPELVDGVPLVQPGIRGRHLLDITLMRGTKGPEVVKYERVTLAGSTTAKGALEDKDIAAQILAHRQEVKSEDTRSKMAERLPTANGARYVGSESCGSCHAPALEKWKTTKHAIAWDTLENAESSGRYKWPVTWYPDCIACHTDGYGEVSGFVAPERTPTLAAVGCESCHGAGSAHSADPIKVKLGPVDSQRCTHCHDFEQSPDFDYRARWTKIEHGK
ncbi:MAG: multiheme c-type cytochrome [Planctomycetota bacterium]